MKIVKKLVVLTAIAIVIQQGIFLYIEKIYLNPEQNIQITKVEEEEEEVYEKNDVITLDSSALDIQVSYSGNYVVYNKNGKITVYNNLNNTENVIECDDEIVFCKWKEKEDNLILFKKVKSNMKQSLVLMPYDVKKEQVMDLADFNRNKSEIVLTNKNDKIDKVTYSILSGSMYVKILKENGNSDLYSVSLENTITKERENIKLDNIIVPSNAKKCIMETNGGISVLGSKDNIKIGDSKENKILGADLNGNTYYAEILNGKVSKIHYRDINLEESKWTSIPLTNPTDINNIYININGQILVNNSIEGTVTELISNQSVKYEGQFMQGMKNGFVARKGNELTKYYFAENDTKK